MPSNLNSTGRNGLAAIRSSKGQSLIFHFLIVVLLTVIGAWFSRGFQPAGLVIWPITSTVIGLAGIYMSPFAGAAAVIASVRMIQSDQAPTPGKPNRQAARIAKVVTNLVLVCLSAYSMVAFGWIVYTVRMATWGAIELWPVVVGGLWLIAATAIGVAAGMHFPATTSSLFCGAAIYLWYIGATKFELPSNVGAFFPIRFFKPGNVSIFETYWPDLGWRLTLLTVGIISLALSLAYYRSTLRSRKLWAPTGIGLICVITGAVTMAFIPNTIAQMSTSDLHIQTTCQKGHAVEVCIHSAYQVNLEVTVKVADAVFGPVVGLPGIPTTIAQFPAISPTSSDQIVAEIYFASNGVGSLLRDYARIVVVDEMAQPLPLSTAQVVIARWLIRQTGMDSTQVTENSVVTSKPDSSLGEAGLTVPETEALINKSVAYFSSLSRDLQNQWLTTHWDDLRTGRLGLGDLPS